MLKKSMLLLLSFLTLSVYAQIDHVEPTFWWIGMKNPHLQLLVNGKNIAANHVTINYAGVKILRVNKVSNPNYLFIDLMIDFRHAKAGIFPITFEQHGKKVLTYRYQLKNRDKGSAKRKSFTSADVVYEIMPDRFANGTTTNDNVPAMIEKVNRSINYGRHGGDILGIEEHLSYLKDLGITAIWCTPLLENNNKNYTYHGYAITDYYKIDPRFGSNEDYVHFVNECHRTGIKVIMDMVSNHCGINHWWMKDLPMKDWIHQFPTYTQCNFQMSTIKDTHVAMIDKENFLDGWFDRSMPDLNQQNPYFWTYFIQNSIWWIEYAHIDGIRMDTYPYNDRNAMSKWAKAITNEYPHFNIVGETWLNNSVDIAFWQKDAVNSLHYNSQLPTVMDFAMNDALSSCFNEQGNQWNGLGMSRLYNIIANDYLYADINHLFVFAENHDTQRYNHTLNGDFAKFKMAMSFLMTTRGIPQIYYGSEIGMTGDKTVGDGDTRRDFPGGWATDTLNAFTAAGRTPFQNDYFNYLSKLLHWRQHKPVIHTGNLIHYIPENDIYVYFRYNEKETVMVILNNNDTTKTLNINRFSQCIKRFTQGTDVMTGVTYKFSPSLTLPKKSALILELK
jgi:glycosidase